LPLERREGYARFLTKRGRRHGRPSVLRGAFVFVRVAVRGSPARICARRPRAEPTRPSEPTTPARRSAGSRVRLHLKPGQKGTKQLLAQDGDRLLCVRYRYDAQRKKRLKTVELVVSERDWGPPSRTPRFADDQLVGLRVAFAEAAVRQRLKQAATWNRERKVWQLRYDRVVALGLSSRIVDDRASDGRCP
jgi:hypothetical protein